MPSLHVRRCFAKSGEGQPPMLTAITYPTMLSAPQSRIVRGVIRNSI